MKELLRHLQHLVNISGHEIDVAVGQCRKSYQMPKRHGPLRHIVVSDTYEDPLMLVDRIEREGGAHAVCDGSTLWLTCAPSRAVNYDAPKGITAKYSLHVMMARPGDASVMLTAALLWWTRTQESVITQVLVHDGTNRDKVWRFDDLCYKALALHLGREFVQELAETPPPPPLGKLTGCGCESLDTGFRVYKLVDAGPEIYRKSPLEERLGATDKRRATA